MKILWVKTDYLHPTTRGGQIRTLKMLEVLHRTHEVHYLTFHDPTDNEGPGRAAEYCTRHIPIPRRIPPRGSPRFALEAAVNLMQSLPLAVARYRSRELAAEFARLRRVERYDSIVCDFLFPAPNCEPLEECVIFQHNVESMIWRRHAVQKKNPAIRAYFGSQARRMWNYEREACRRAAHVVAVSETDAAILRKEFDIDRVSWVATGVDLGYFTPPGDLQPQHELAFVGSMDWMPNVDGVDWFLDEVFPRIIARRPETTVVIIGRKPPAGLLARAAKDPRIRVTGTVDDVRPHLWRSQVSIVPLRIGSGTRLKIYEAMAARLPVVSTTLGAEGLTLDDGVICLAETPEAFAASCIDLLQDAAVRQSMGSAAWEMVRGRFSWERVSRDFEGILERAAATSRPSSGAPAGHETTPRTSPR